MASHAHLLPLQHIFHIPCGFKTQGLDNVVVRASALEPQRLHYTLAALAPSRRKSNMHKYALTLD